jgi:hypothetical protein
MAAEVDPRTARLEARRRAYRGISFGTTLICVGVVLLLNTLGRLGWGVWFDLLRLWPLLLISLGIRSIFVPTRLHPLAAIGPLLVVTATAITVSWYRGAPGEGDWDPSRGESLTLSCPGPLRDAAARLHLTFAVGRMGLVSERSAGTPPAGPPPGAAHPAGSTESTGLGGTLRYVGSEPPWACSNEGDLWLGAEGSEGGLHIVLPFTSRREQWEARLSSPVPVSVRGDLLAATASLDLRAFDLDHVDLDLAATNARIRLGPPSRRVGVRLDGAAAQVKLRMPAGVCWTISRERVFSVMVGDALPEGRGRRGRRVVASVCPGDLGGDVPRYDFRIQMPFSTVSVETDDGA